MKGAGFASRFSFPPNHRGYCGKPSFRRSLLSHLGGRGTESSLEREIRLFPVHYSYLKLIARENGMRPFDLRVARAFWIGNSLLESVSRETLARFIRRDLFRGKESARVRKLCDGLPEGLVPHHSFNALYVNFVTDAVERNERNFDSCCITWGEVVSSGKGQAVIQRESVSWDGGFSLKRRRSAVDLERSGVRLVEEFGKGDILAVHWGMAVRRISRRDADSLRRYTLMNMKAINESEEAV